MDGADPGLLTREEFIRAMGGQEKIDAMGRVVVPCACGHECCRGWNVIRADEANPE